MKITVDHSLCEGHAKCMERAPEVFEVDDEDLSQVIATNLDAELLAKVERAVRSCPRQAINLDS